MGGYDEAQQVTTTAWVHDLQAGSSWRQWANLPEPCSKPALCALGEFIYVHCGIAHSIEWSNDTDFPLLRYDKQGNLLETIQKPDAIRDAMNPALCAINGRLFIMTQVDADLPSYRMDSYDPATGAWQRMPDPQLQAFGCNFGAVEHAGKLYVIGGNVWSNTVTGGIDSIVDVRVFDGQEWSVGPPLPTPEVCHDVVSAGHSILALFDNCRRACVLHNGTWRSYSSEETELIAFPYYVVPRYCALAGHSA
jgi:hypothetical protein